MTARALLLSILLSGLLAAEDVVDRETLGDAVGAGDDVETPPDESKTSADLDEYGIPLGPLTLEGNIYQKYRYRHTGAGTDQDIYGFLNLDATYPAGDADGKRPYSEIAFNLQASYNLDIDSFRTTSDAASETSYVPFLDSTNTFSDRFHGFVHSAYGEVLDVAGLERFRVGRQQIYREFGLLFDGGYARTKPWKTVSFDVYGGLPAHLYESSTSGNALVGGGVETRPLEGLTLGADYYYLRDDADFVTDEENHVYYFRGRYDVNREWSFGGSASWVDTRDRRQTADVRYVSEEWGFSGNLRVVRQNAVVEFQSAEISPYVYVEGKYAPYYQYQLDFYQPLGEKFGVGGGLNLRHLEDSSDEGLYNHDFRNYYLGLDARDLWRGGSASVQADLWDSDQDDIYSVGFEIEQKVADLLRIRVGTSYHLYRIDLFTGKERERDRVYYARFRWHLTPRIDLDTDYQYEKDSITEYHTVTAGLGLWF